MFPDDFHRQSPCSTESRAHHVHNPGALPGLVCPGSIFAPLRAVATHQLAGSGQEGVIRVGTYNIAHGRGGALGTRNWTGSNRKQVTAHLRKTGDFIRGQQLDLIILNEVDISAAWSRHVNQARVIAETASFPYVAEQRNIDTAAPFSRFRFGNAVLRKYPITHADMVEFPPLSRLEKRLAGNHDGLLTSVDMPSGSLQALAVHSEVRDESTRVGYSDQVSSIAKEFGIPFLVLGDFNSTPSGYSGHQSDAEGRNANDHLLRLGHFPAGQAPPPDFGYLTFPSAGPDRAIDWILATGDCELRNPRVISADLSDHLMVVADVVVNLHR